MFGVALVAMSGGRWGFADAWVSVGMAAWAVVAVAAEALLWPAERRLQAIVASGAVPHTGVEPTGGRRPEPAGGTREPAADPAALCLQVGLLGLGAGVVLVAVGVLMVAKP